MASQPAEQLRSFLSMFRPRTIEILRDDKEVVRARLEWNLDPKWDDESDRFESVEWRVQPNMADAALLAQLIFANDLLSIDKILLPEAGLIELATQKLGMAPGRAQEAVDQLIEFVVQRFDDDQKGDLYFVHF